MKASTKTVLVLSVGALVAAMALLVVVLTTCHSSHQIAGVNDADPPVKVVERGSKASWSPDGQQIVSCGKSGAGLQVLDLRAQASRALQVQGSDPSWSPAGPFIAFMRRGSYDTTSNYLREEVWLLPLKEGTPRRLVRGGFPSWSADGQVLYVHSRVDNQILALKVNEPDAAPTVFYETLMNGPAARTAYGWSGVRILTTCSSRAKGPPRLGDRRPVFESARFGLHRHRPANCLSRFATFPFTRDEELWKSELVHSAARS